MSSGDTAPSVVCQAPMQQRTSVPDPQLIRTCFRLPPISIAATEKTFSAFVLGETLPKPTDVRLVQVKYRAEMYDVMGLGRFERSLLIGSSSFSDN